MNGGQGVAEVDGKQLEQLLVDAYTAGYRRALADFAEHVCDRPPSRWRRVWRALALATGLTD